MPLETGNAPSNASPLWVIALFIALCEVMAGVAAIITDGTTRLIFAIFATAFPNIVLAAFVWLVLKHPANLYSPGQYTAQTTVGDYVQALSKANREREIVYGQVVAEAVATAVSSQPQTAARHPDAEQVRRQVAIDIESLVEKASVTVERAALIENGEPVQIPVTSDTTVGALLDWIFFTISSAVDPYTYNSSWLLADENGRLLTEMGTTWARKQGWTSDIRPVKDVGIQPGSRLIVLPAKPRSSRLLPPGQATA